MTQAAAYLEKKVGKWISDHSDEAKEINAKVIIELTGAGGGRWLIDCTTDPGTIKKNNASSAQTVISMEVSTFELLTSGELSPESAFLSGQVKVEGDLGLSIRLGQLLI